MCNLPKRQSVEMADKSPLFLSRGQEAVGAERQLNAEPRLWIIQVETADFLDALHPVEERIPVNKEGFGSLAEISFVGKIGDESLDQISPLCPVILYQWSDDFVAKSSQFRAVLQLE